MNFCARFSLSYRAAIAPEFERAIYIWTRINFKTIVAAFLIARGVNGTRQFSEEHEGPIPGSPRRKKKYFPL
jgi:hypothetical protein